MGKGMFTSRRGCFCFSLRALSVLAWIKLVMDISFISYHFYNLSGLLDLYKINVKDTADCEMANKTTEEGETTEEIIVSSCQLPIFWITVTPVLKLLMDIAFDISIIFGCIKKNVDLLIISYGYSALMAVFYLVGFCYVLILHLDYKRAANILQEYFMTVMPLVVVVNDLDIGVAKTILKWLLWISYVGVMSFYLPYLLRAEVTKMRMKDEFVTNDPSQEADVNGILYAPLKQGLFKMLIVKSVVVAILAIYTAYFVTAMYKLHVNTGHNIITVLSIITPLLMLDTAFNVVLYVGQNKQDTSLLQMYCTYNGYIRLLNVVVAIGIKYYEFTFYILQYMDNWVILLYNFHVYLVLWIVYIVVHFYVELLTEMEIAKFSNGIPLPPVSTVVELSTDSNDQCRKRISE